MSHGGEVLTAGSELARKRLAAYARLAELVLEQEAALKAEDLERFDELTERVTELRDRVGSAASNASGGSSLGVLSGENADEAERLLRATLVRSERIHTRLAALRRDAGSEIRRLGAGRATGRRYMEASESILLWSAPRVDVKL